MACHCLMLCHQASSANGSGLVPISFMALSSSRRTAPAPPTMGMFTGTFLEIEEGSTSIWMILASGQK
jgi:hypothetical protein